MNESAVADVLKAAYGQVKRGRPEEGLALLQGPLRQGLPDAEEMDRAGRLIRKALAAGAEAGKPLRVALVGQFTTSWAATMLVAEAWGRNTLLEVSEGGFDTVLQDLSMLPAAADRPDVVVLLPWNQRLFGGEAEHAARVGGRAGLLAAGMGDRAAPGGLADPPGRLRLGDARGHGGPPGGRGGRPGRRGACAERSDPQAPPRRRLLPRPGARLRDAGPRSLLRHEALLLDEAAVQRGGYEAAGRELWAGIRALTTGPKKVLVARPGQHAMGWGRRRDRARSASRSARAPTARPSARSRSTLKELAGRGIVLAVASKNNPADAREPFEKNPDMVLRLDDFAAFEACWDPKAVSIRRIAEGLNLGLDSFVFFDDNPAERELIRQALPEVEVVEVPPDPPSTSVPSRRGAGSRRRP